MYMKFVNDVVNSKEKELRPYLDLNGPCLSKRWTQNTRPTSGPSWVRFPEPYLAHIFHIHHK